MFKKLHNALRQYIKKDFVQDEFDGNYPFNLNEIPFTRYKSFGEKNPDKVFFVIYRTPYEAGFFSNVDHIIHYLKLIKGKNFIPVVDFENFKTIYNEQNPINGTNNSWEYYFEQISPYSLDEVYQSKHVLFCDGIFPHNVPLDNGKESHEYLKKIFNVKNNILEMVKPYEETFSNNRILGVHFRGKEQNIAPNHPFGPTVKQMFKYTDELVEKYNLDKIFIVTEDQNYLEHFIKRYKDKLIYTNSFRNKKGNIFNTNPRENHRYLLGAEVLVDTILLTKCQGILCGDSNVSLFAKILNLNYDFSYTINNGFNSSNKYKARFLYNIKKNLPRFMGGLLEDVEIVTNEGI